MSYLAGRNRYARETYPRPPSSVFGTRYQRIDSPGLFTTGAGVVSPQPFVVKPGASLTTPVLTGTYKISWHALVSASAANVTAGVRLFNATDAAIVGSSPQLVRPAASSLEIEDVNGSNDIVFAGVSRTFQIEVQKFAGPPPGAVTIQDAWIELWRVT